jgi:GrpB-like predicted nucleotidyltransferase (UPF0157 family)
MNDTSHIQLLSHQSFWKEKFQSEKDKIQKIFSDKAIGIEHIGSTSIDGLSSKPIIDIAVLIEKREYADNFIEGLNKIEYWYDKPNSSGERHFFRKGNPTEFHLSIAYSDKGNFWERQIIFRDYLRNHSDVRDGYAKLKENLLRNDQTGKAGYVVGKTEFVQKILNLAKEKRVK